MSASASAGAHSAALSVLVDHIGRMTGERRRPRLEEILVESLRDALGARRVAYHKLLMTAGESFCWLAVEANAAETRVVDDGVSVPPGLQPLETLPVAFDVMISGTGRTLALPDGVRLVHPIPGPGSAAGFLEVDLALPPAGDSALLLQALGTSFRNIMDLLDYSETDTLTGLLNRKTFDEYLMLILASLAEDDDSVAAKGRSPRRRHTHAPGDTHWLAVLDIDHFKRINDNHGHLIGDEVLLMVANRMRASFRFRDKLFRFGGEEFVVVLKPTGAAQARAALERFRQQLETQAFPQVGQVTISTGFAPIRLHDQPSVVIDRADEALYWAKANGRNRVAGYEDLVASGDIHPQPTRESDVELF